MKGDVYDDGSPNPLVVKCPNCGGENITGFIGTGSSKYRCNACGNEFSHTCITGSASFRSCPNCGVPMGYNYIWGTWYCTSCGCIEQDNIEMSDKTEATKEQNISAGSLRYGWVCPKCGKVYAPYVKECWNCNCLTHISAPGRINQSSSAETHIEGITMTMNTQEKRVRQDGSLVIDKSWFPNLTKDSTVYAGGGGTRWNKTTECEHCNQEGGTNSNSSSK